MALSPTLFESGDKNAQELRDIIAARGKDLPEISVPEVAKVGCQAVRM